MSVVIATVQMEPGTWLRIALMLLGALALSRVLPRLVRRAVLRVLDTRVRERFAVLRAHAPRALVDSGPTPSVRYAQRAEALGTLVTGAGFLGVAIALGDIEEMNLRWACIRDTRGTQWYVPNGRLQEVGNRSQHRGKAIIDVDVPSEMRLAEAEERIAKALCSLRDDPRVGTFDLEEPEVLGVETLTRQGATIRVAVHTSAAKQTEVARVVRARVRTAFERGASGSSHR